MIPIMKKRSILPLISLIAGCLSGCESAPTGDVYSAVKDACNYTIPGGSKAKVTDAEKQSSSLTAECRTALEAILPYDSTMRNLPQWKLDQVTEAFQILVGYPLSLPSDGRIFGVAPYSIPLSAFCVFEPQAHPKDCPTFWGGVDGTLNLNRNVFNFVAKQFANITYGGDTDPGHIARYDLISLDKRTIMEKQTLKVFSGFWDPIPFQRAATLTHEAYHGEFNMAHTFCGDGSTDCDSDLSGAYSMNISYTVALMQGSGSVKHNGELILSDLDLLSLGFANCYYIRANLLNYPKELHTLLDPLDCSVLGADWYTQQEGLLR